MANSKGEGLKEGITSIIPVISDVIGYFRTKKVEEEASYREEVKAQASVDIKKIEEDSNIVQKSVDTTVDIAKSSVSIIKELSQSSMEYNSKIVEEGMHLSSKITKDILKDKALEREHTKGYIEFIKDGSEKALETIITIQQEQQNKIDIKNREVIGYKKALDEVKKYHIIESVKNKFIQNISQFSNSVMLSKQEVMNTKLKIKQLEEKLKPHKEMIDRISIDIEILFAKLDDLNKKFDEQIHLIRYLKDKDDNKDYEKEKGKLHYIEMEIREKELKLLNKELEKSNKEESIVEDLKKYEEYKYVLEYLESQEIQVFLSGLNKIISNSESNSLMNREETVIDTQVEETHNFYLKE